MRLSVDDLALLTYCLGVAPSPGMGALDQHQVSTPTDVTEPPDIMSVSEWCITLFWVAVHLQSTHDTCDNIGNQLSNPVPKNVIIMPLPVTHWSFIPEIIYLLKDKVKNKVFIIRDD